MSNFSKRVFAVAFLCAFSLSLSSVSYAAEGENSLTGFFRKLFNYPVKATQGAGEMTSNTLHNTGEKVVSQAGENTAEILQGNIAATGELAADAVTGSLETVGQTTAETVQIPVEAAQDPQQ